MVRLWLVVAALSLGFLSSPSQAGLSRAKVHTMADSGFIYNDHTREQKVDALYRELSRDVYDQHDCPSVIGGVFPFLQAAWNSYRTRGLRKTLERKGPEYGPEEAPKFKLFHTYGAAFIFHFSPAFEEEKRNRFTGIWQDNFWGIARWSQAGPVLGGVGWVPALSMKVPRDFDHPDIDMLVMNGLDPIASGIFYQPLFKQSAPMSNILPMPWSPIMKFVAHRFRSETVSGKEVNQSVDHSADRDLRGVPIENPRAPFRIILQGHPEAAKYERRFTDFRAMAAGIPEGTALYEVFGLTEEQELQYQGVRSIAKHITPDTYLGRIYLRSPVVPSFYGDHMLHVGHSKKWQLGGPNDPNASLAE